MRKFPKLLRTQVDDPYVQENFKRLGDFARQDAIIGCNFQFLSLTVPAAGVNQKLEHNLNFKPLDVIILSNSTNATVVLNYSLFDETFINLNSSGPTVLRLLLGRYE